MIDPDKLDKTIHERGRLLIMSLLAARPEWSFPDLKQELGMSDGNLITHLRTLQKAGYVTMDKVSEGEGRPITQCAITGPGRTAFDEYLQFMEELVRLSRGED